MRIRNTIAVVCFFVFNVNIAAQKGIENNYNDGPYIQITEDSLITFWVESKELKRKANIINSPYGFESSLIPSIQIDIEQGWTRTQATKHLTDYPIVAISDIHGQFGVFVNLLKAHNVIDDEMNWLFDKGSLVIVGDVMGRGAQVMECLWLIFKLEQQAVAAGGNVHFLLGNHELMVMNGNLNYLNKKYLYTSALMKTPYFNLVGMNTLMGQWLASKNVILQINDKLFVHGGLSQQAMSLGLSVEEINQIFKDKLYFKNQMEIESVPELATLYFEEGPLWFRGYAYPYSFNKNGIDSVLTSLDINNIIVGHTTLPKIKGLYKNKIILIDSSIKLGKSGELLLIDETGFSVGGMDGAMTPLVSEEKKTEDRKSLFNFLQAKEKVSLHMSVKIKDILNNFNKSDQATGGVITITANNEQFIFSSNFKPGGKSRRKICNNPPVKINLKKKELSNFNFSKDYDNLKIVFQCKKFQQYAESIKLEKFIYDLHNIITTFSHQAKLVKIGTVDKKDPLYGFLLESREGLCKRTNLKEIEVSTISTSILDRVEYVRMCLFQFMIANTDWSAVKMHNSKFYQKLEDKTFVTIPYDFDNCGMINNKYAVPSEKLPISKVTQRHFMDKKISLDELEKEIEYFISIEDTIKRFCTSIDYLSDDSKKRVEKFIDKFYETIKDTNRMQSMVKK